jgi:hypothetical protein
MLFKRSVPAAVLLFSSPLICAVVPATAAQAAEGPAPVAEGRAPAPAGGEQEPEWDPKRQLFWIDAQAGIESVQLQTFNADFESVSVGFLPTSGVGPTANVGGGFRLLFLTLGVRGRVTSFENSAPGQDVSTWQIWTLDGEAGLRIPLGRLEPHAAIALGYASFGGFDTAVRGLSAGLDVHGVDARVGGGLDYWVAPAVSVGVDASAGLLAVAREGVSARDLATPKQVGTINEAKARVLEANGSSVGSTFALTAALGLHF